MKWWVVKWLMPHPGKIIDHSHFMHDLDTPGQIDAVNIFLIGMICMI